MNRLTTIVNETFTEFVEGYQKELSEDTGIKFGHLEAHAFNNVILEIDKEGNPLYLGQEASQQIYQHLLEKEYISNNGKILDSLREDFKANRLDLGQEFEPDTQKQILNIIKQVAGTLEIKNKDAEIKIEVNKEVYLSDDFKELWDKIKYKTIYQVDFSSKQLIEKCIDSINKNVHKRSTVFDTVVGVLDIDKGGIGLKEDIVKYSDHSNVEVSYLPDIITYLQDETDLTRASIVKILKGLEERVLGYFKNNPQHFIEKCIEIINLQKRLFIVDGIKYHKIGEDAYYDQKLIEEEDLFGYVKERMVEAKKSVYEYIVCDSNVEVNLAKEFEQSENVKLYTKLPRKFTVPTPLGNYNPDWAILYDKNGEESLYFVVESKGELFEDLLRPIEKGKIECGKEHFKTLSSRMIVATNIDDVHNQV